MNKKSILIVDDEPGNLEVIQDALTRHGYESVPCSDSMSALTVLASGVSLDLAIIDFIMPDMNGLELHRRLKQLRPGLPCIMVTGHSSIETYLKAINSGVFEYLHKPYRMSELKTVVAAALSNQSRETTPVRIENCELTIDH